MIKRISFNISLDEYLEMLKILRDMDLTISDYFRMKLQDDIKLREE